MMRPPSSAKYAKVAESNSISAAEHVNVVRAAAKISTTQLNCLKFEHW